MRCDLEYIFKKEADDCYVLYRYFNKNPLTVSELIIEKTHKDEKQIKDFIKRHKLTIKLIIDTDYICDFIDGILRHERYDYVCCLGGKGYWEEDYNANGDSIFYQTSTNDYWIKSKYNSNNKLIRRWYSTGQWYYYKHDCNGELIYEANNTYLEDGKIYWVKYKRNDRGQIIERKWSDGKYENFTFNGYGKMTSYSNSENEYYEYSYTESGDIVINKNFQNFEENLTFDVL